MWFGQPQNQWTKAPSSQTSLHLCSWASLSLSGLQNCTSWESPARFWPQCQPVVSSKHLLGWMPHSLALEMLLLPALIFQSHWVYSSPLQEQVCKSCRIFKAVHFMQVKTVLCIQHHEQRALERERVKLKGLWDPLLGTAESLAEAPNTAFTSADQEPFEFCPEFRTSFSSLPSPPHLLRPCPKSSVLSVSQSKQNLCGQLCISKSSGHMSLETSEFLVAFQCISANGWYSASEHIKNLKNHYMLS